MGDHLGLVKTLEQMSEEEWDALYQVNLRHLFVVTRAALPLMRRSGMGGSIINVSSVEAFRGNPYNALYTTFKHGVTGFTRAMALELATDNIRVNAIAPETTDSEQVPLAHILKDNQPCDLLGQKAFVTRTLPSNRFGRAQDHAGAAVFLVTGLSGWVNGSTVHTDGGSLVAGGFQRTPRGEWTIIPEVSDKGTVI